jgi:HK97 family phage portal protein
LLLSSNIRPSYASSEANSADFVKYTIRGLATRWESAINRRLFNQREQNAGYYVKFNLDALLRADLATRYNSYAVGITNGVLAPNEARKFENLPPLVGGNEPFRPLNMVKLSDETVTNPTQ